MRFIQEMKLESYPEVIGFEYPSIDVDGIKVFYNDTMYNILQLVSHEPNDENAQIITKILNNQIDDKDLEKFTFYGYEIENLEISEIEDKELKDSLKRLLRKLLTEEYMKSFTIKPGQKIETVYGGFTHTFRETDFYYEREKKRLYLGGIDVMLENSEFITLEFNLHNIDESDFKKGNFSLTDFARDSIIYTDDYETAMYLAEFSDDNEVEILLALYRVIKSYVALYVK